MKREATSPVAMPDPDQATFVCVSQVSLGEHLTWAAQRPIQPKRGQRPLDIGFWDPTRNQLEMF